MTVDELSVRAGAPSCRCIRSYEVIAYEDPGCELAKRLYAEEFPLVVGIDCRGYSIFQ